MAYVCRHPAFTVTVESGFVEKGRFAVHGRVSYAPKVARGIRNSAETAALLAMIAGISRESQSGRERGARRVYISVDGDRGLSGIFRRIARRNRLPRAAKETRVGILAH